ncbi:MAG TPA: 50S ribosomal protein L32 [Synergistaceae bacterium]|nr:50S ribosomal protein L32 [Synergistaceae bacterium]
MALPKRHVSHSKTHSRKAQWLRAVKAPAVTTCTHCGEVIQSYQACPSCGYYRGRKVLTKTEEGEE